MEIFQFEHLNRPLSKVGLGTWVMGGWLWGGVDDEDSARAIETAIQKGINLIDTAPIYGCGHSEEVIGRIVQKLKVRDKVVLATKFGLDWGGGKEAKEVKRLSSRKRILEEIDESRRRLQTDVIDIYQVHWPDEATPFGETMETLLDLYEKKIIKAIGLSNFSVPQIKECLKYAPIHTLQPPLNLYERETEAELLPFCQEKGILLLTYGAICRGMLSGKMTLETKFKDLDIRNFDPKFKRKNLVNYIATTDKLKAFAEARGLTVSQLAIQWVARKPGVVALVGCRTSQQAQDNADTFKVKLNDQDYEEVERIVEEGIPTPLPAGFMAPKRSVPASAKS